MVTIGITTYNRKALLKTMAESLYDSDISVPHNIRIYDDCSTEYGIDELRTIFPDAVSIAINKTNLRSDKNIYLMYKDFATTSDDYLFNADSDILFGKNWLNRGLELIEQTEGILSLFNSNSHEPYEKLDNEFCLKKTIGSAGTFFRKDRVDEILLRINSLDKVTSFDWQFCEYFCSKKVPIYCVNKSLVQHIGYVGQNTQFYFDYGRNFRVESSNQGQIINDMFENFIDDIRQKEIERRNISGLYYHIKQCIKILIRTILPKKIFNYINIRRKKQK